MAILLIEPDEFDLVVVGSGLPELLIASSVARAGKSVLIIDAVDTYGSDYSSFSLASLQQCAMRSTASNSTVQAVTDTAGVERAQAPKEKPLFPLPEGWRSHSVPAPRLPVYNVQMFKLTADSSSSYTISDKEARIFVLDLAPKMLYQAEALVKLMVRTQAHKYVDFKLVEGSYIFHRGVLASVPASKSDIFKDKRLTLGEKRSLMKFINSMSSPVAINSGASSEEPTATGVGNSFLATLQAAGLSQDLQHIILHAIALADYDQEYTRCHAATQSRHASADASHAGTDALATNAAAPATAAATTGVAASQSASTTAALATAAPTTPETAAAASEAPATAATVAAVAVSAAGATPGCTSFQESQGWMPSALVSEQQGRESLQLFMDSMACFNPGSAFMVPCFGSGSLPEAFVRQAAVFGAVTVLRQPVQALVTNPSAGGECCAIMTNSGQLIKCKAMVAAASVAQVLLPSSLMRPSVVVTHRALLIMDSSLAASQCNLTLVIPPNSPGLHNRHAIRGLQIGPSTIATPIGRYVLYLSTPAHSTDSEQVSPYLALWRAAAALTRTDLLADGVLNASFGLEPASAQHSIAEVHAAGGVGESARQDEHGPSQGGFSSDKTSSSNCSSSSGGGKATDAATKASGARPLALHAYFYDQHSYVEPLCGPTNLQSAHASPVSASCSSDSNSNSNSTQQPQGSCMGGKAAAGTDLEGSSGALPSNVGCCYGPDLSLAGYQLAVEQAERLCARLLPGVPWLPARSVKWAGGGLDGAGGSDEQEEGRDEDGDGDYDAIKALQDAMVGLSQQPATVPSDLTSGDSLVA